MVILGGNTSVAMSTMENSTNVIKVDEQDHYHEDWIPPFQFRDGVCIKTNEKFSDYYELQEEIGEGKFGKVYRCVERATGLVLAAKCIRLKRDADLQKVEKEVNIMTQMRHKCIAQIYDAFATSTNNDVILIMEIVQGGELFDRVVDESYILTEMAVAMIVHQICEAIRYIHQQNIIHLDLKPENIMCVSQTGNQIKLIDFGLAQYFDGQSDLLFMAGTPEFAAPEVIKYEPLDFHTDMWSVGVITYILLSGQSPFLGENVAHTYCNVERGKWEFCDEFRENCITTEAQDFIARLLVVDKSQRMLPDECLRHPWITLFRERSRNANIQAERPLDVGKLRSYVRNKRFRRLVFGVLFVNTIVRMMSTLQDRKSEHGIQYVKNMLSAAKKDDSQPDDRRNGEGGGAGAMIKSLFSKSSHKEKTVDKSNADTSLNLEMLTDEAAEKYSTKNGEALQKPSLTVTNDMSSAADTTTTSSADEKAISSPTRQRRVLKSKRVKSASRKASSTEQAPQKRTKTSTPTAELRVDADDKDDIGDDKNQALVESPHSTTAHVKFETNHDSKLPEQNSKNNETESKPSYGSISKMKIASIFEDTSAPLQFPVAGAPPPKVVNNEPKKTNKPEVTHKGENVKHPTMHAKSPVKIQADDDTRQKILSATKVNLPHKTGKSALIETLPSSSKSSNVAEGKEQCKPSPLAQLQPIQHKEAQLTRARTPDHNKEKSVKIERDRSLSRNRPAKTEDQQDNTGSSKSIVGSILKKLENNDSSAGIKMAVTGFMPIIKPSVDISEKIRRRGSVEELLNTSTSEKRLRRQKSYKAQGSHKTTTVMFKIKDDTSEPSKTSEPNDKSPNQRKAILKTKTKLSTTIDDVQNESTNSSCTELESVRRKLRSVGSIPNITENIEKNDSNKSHREHDLKVHTLPGKLGSLISNYDAPNDKISGRPDGKKEKEIVKAQLLDNERSQKSPAITAQQRQIDGDGMLEKCGNGQTEMEKTNDSLTPQPVRKMKTNTRRLSGEEETKTVNRAKKVAIKPKKLVKKVSVEKKERKSEHLSLNDLTNSMAKKDSSNNMNGACSHNVLVSDWTHELKRNSQHLQIDRAPAEFTNQQGRPKSENDLSKNKERNGNGKRSLSKTRSSPLDNKESTTAARSDSGFSFEYDAFDFSALRLKLQQRIMGIKDESDLATEEENRQKCESRVQIHDPGTIKKTRNKWINMDKATAGL